MRKIGFGAALLSVFAGSVGFILRRLFLTRAIEPDTGLPVIGSPALIAMVIYTGFIIILALALAFCVRRTSIKKYSAVIAPVNTVYCVIACAASLLLLVSGAVSIPAVFSGEATNYVQLLRAVLIILTGVCIVGMTTEALKKKEPNGSYVFSIIPEVAMTFWLLIYYRTNQTNPVLLDYVFFALALASSAFAFYFTAGYVYGRCAPVRFVFSHSVAVYFLLTSLSDGVPAADKMAFSGLALFFILNLSRFVGNFRDLKTLQ